MPPSVMLRDARFEDEKRHFLEDDLEQFSENHDACPSKTNIVSRNWKSLLIMQSIIIAALILTLLRESFGFGVFLATNKGNSLYTPLRPHIKYNIDQPPEGYWDDKLYVLPSYASDYAWNDIMFNQTVRIHDEDVQALNMTHLPLSRVHGGGYATILGVFHNLHCLRRIRQSMFQDYYSANVSEAQKEHDAGHAYHCLEVLRTSLMCHADLSLYPLIGGGSIDHPLLANVNVPRECVDWDALMEGIESRHYAQTDIIPAI